MPGDNSWAQWITPARRVRGRHTCALKRISPVRTSTPLRSSGGPVAGTPERMVECSPTIGHRSSPLSDLLQWSPSCRPLPPHPAEWGIPVESHQPARSAPTTRPFLERRRLEIYGGRQPVLTTTTRQHALITFQYPASPDPGHGLLVDRQRSLRVPVRRSQAGRLSSNTIVRAGPSHHTVRVMEAGG